MSSSRVSRLRLPDARRFVLRWLTSVLLFLGTAPTASADWPAWIERLLFNPSERTQRGIESFGGAAAGSASEPLETALRLQGDDPVAQYNAGTARLAGGGDAQSLLASAATQGAGDLVPAARYNLGKARLDSSDLPGAIEAFKEALRHDPSHEDAKFNLELAQRLLEQQQEQQNQDQQNQDQQNQDQQNQDQQDQDQQDQDQEDQQNQDQQDPQEQQQDQQEQQQDQQEQQQDQQEQQQQSEQQEPGQQQQQQQQRPLPQFEDLPDMTAEEAAAILEAIENMEREQRREEALEAAKQHSGAKKDW